MISPRLLRLTLHLFEGLFTCATVFPFSGAPRRERLVRNWSRRLLVICGVTCTTHDRRDPAGPPRALIVSNHTSWLDIFVINAQEPCRFVARADIRGWPLVGWLAYKAGTLFISRGKKSEVRQVYEGLVARIQAGERVAFFPEGGTAEQGTLRPFHANLFEAAISAGVPIQPYAVRYLDEEGRLHPATRYTGDTSFGQSVTSIAKAGGVRAELYLLPAIHPNGAHRRELAALTRQSIAQSLGAALGPPEPADRRAAD